ncbi:MAG: WD40 repeat domain-containing protein [Chloroflexi bacterium]|nr:WD40 repeat domain-containing protein [Chloroflexota bacterium]
MTASTLKMNNRAYTIAILVCFLACLPYWIQAQERVSWEAESIFMSNDGQHLAVGYEAYVKKEDRDEPGYDSGVWIYDLDDLSSPPRYLRGASSDNTFIAISSDSRYISLAEYQRLEIFNIGDNSLILDMQRTATEKPLDLSTISYSADGKFIMFLSDWWATREHEMSIWDIDTGSRVLSIPAVRAGQSHQLPKLSPDWRHFLDWWHPDGIQIHEFDTQQGLGAALGVVPINASDVRGIAFSPDSSLFGLVMPDGEIKIYRTNTWELSYTQVLGEYSCGNSDVTLAFGHINPWLIFRCHTYGCASQCEWYGGLVVLDFETGAFLLIQNKAPSPRYITPDDGLLVAGTFGRVSEYSEITVWDAKGDFEMSVYPGTNPQVHPNGELMAATGPDGRVWIWNIKSKELLEVLPIPRQ